MAADPRVEEIRRELESKLSKFIGTELRWPFSCQYYPPTEPDEPHSFVCESTAGSTFNLDDLREIERILARRGARLYFFEVEASDDAVILGIDFYFEQ
jgi:hypothetical protein